MTKEFFDIILTASKNVGAGIATVGLVGAGAGDGSYRDWETDRKSVV